MRFMLMSKADSNYEAGFPPNAELMAAIGKLTEEMTKGGILVGAGGLMPSSQGARMRLAGGKLSVTDGPFAEAKEIIGGYAIVQVKSKQEAIDLAKRFMEIHKEILGPSYEGESEIRQMYDSSECGPEAAQS
jgi:hypothetical protein